MARGAALDRFEYVQDLHARRPCETARRADHCAETGRVVPIGCALQPWRLEKVAALPSPAVNEDGESREPSGDVTVVVPTYCRPHLLDRMVQALERQTLSHDRFDVVIVDNGSPDDTSARLAQLAAASPLRLRPMIERRSGPAAARNTGWRASDADVIAFVDDDCVPEPGWLAAGLDAMRSDPHLGVVQGSTRKPLGATTGDWTLWREITEPSPYFEGCNIFYRRAALEQTGGFDEDIAYYGEDTSLGWAVLERGWQRGFAEDAVAYHDLEERGLRYHLKVGLLERNAARLAKRYPAFRQAGFWRPWAFRRENAYFALAVVGTVVAVRKPAAIVLALPYLRLRLPGPDHPRRLQFFAERVLVDAARAAGMQVGAVRWRIAAL
jgi:GT2 family glycosyltransferase